MTAKIKILFLMFFIFSYAGVFSQEQGTVQEEKKNISYAEYMNTMISTLPEIQSNGINLLLQENELEKVKSISDISINAGGSLSSSDVIQNGTKGSVTGTDISAGLSKVFTSTGTRLSVNGGWSKTGYRDFGTSPDSDVFSAPFIGVTATQPLLKNFLGKVDSFSEKNAEMQVETEKVRLLENNKITLNAYKKMYFQWILACKQVGNSTTSLENSRAQLNQVRKNFNAGIVEEDDLQKSTASTLDYEQELETKNTDLRNIKKSLAVYIDTENLSPEENSFNELYNEAAAADYAYADFSTTNSCRLMDLTAKRLIYSQGVYENRLLPDLNITGSYTGKNLTSDSSKQFSAPGDKDWKLGFEFVYSLGNSQAEGELKDIEIQLKALEYEKKTAENSYKKMLSSISSTAAGTKIRIKKKEQYLNALSRQLVTEKKKYRQGRLNLSYVLTTENLISSARTDLDNLKYQLISLYIDYKDVIK